MLSIRDVLMRQVVSSSNPESLCRVLPTSVAVPGGLALRTSSLESLNAALKDVIAADGMYKSEWKAKKPQ